MNPSLYIQHAITSWEVSYRYGWKGAGGRVRYNRKRIIHCGRMRLLSVHGANRLGCNSLLVRAFRYLFDSRDEGLKQRIALLDNKDGAWGCQTKWMCTKVCPKEIPVTKQIFEVKKQMLEGKKEKK